MRMFEDNQPLSKEERERNAALQILREDNLRLIKEELSGKRVVLKSNLHERQERVYLVDEVKDDYVSSEGSRLLRGFRLVNQKTSKEEQPFFKYPTELISKTREGNLQKLTLVYAAEMKINEQGFRRLHRDSKPDLEVYIYY